MTDDEIAAEVDCLSARSLADEHRLAWAAVAAQAIMQDPQARERLIGLMMMAMRPPRRSWWRRLIRRALLK